MLYSILCFNEHVCLHCCIAEPTESSDSGVDANSVSSCEMSSQKVETPRDTFNKQQCVDYLRNGEYNLYLICLFICLILSTLKEYIPLFMSDYILALLKRCSECNETGNSSALWQLLFLL